MNLRSTPTPVSACLQCGHRFDTVTACDSQDPPQPGDLTLCVECGEVHKLTAQMTVVAADLNDLLKLKPEQHRLVDRAQLAIRAYRAARERRRA
jgi:hypothetical protein